MYVCVSVCVYIYIYLCIIEYMFQESLDIFTELH
jgi:hypothetical protein